MAGKTTKKAAAKKKRKKPTLLAAGNPQIAKADGEAVEPKWQNRMMPVQRLVIPELETEMFNACVYQIRPDRADADWRRGAA